MFYDERKLLFVRDYQNASRNDYRLIEAHALHERAPRS